MLPEQQVVEDLLQNLDKLSNFEFKDATNQRRAMLATRAVSDKLQQSGDKFMEIWAQGPKDAALKTCIDLDLFAKWKAAGSPRTADELAEMVSVQPLLMSVSPCRLSIRCPSLIEEGSLLKHLAACHIIHENGCDLYSQTDFTLALIDPEKSALIKLHFESFIPTFGGLPEYLRSCDYNRPFDFSKPAFSYAKGFGGSFWEYASTHKSFAQTFDMAMKGFTKSQKSWLETISGDWLIESSKPGQKLVVDVGGGLGHDLVEFVKRFPKASPGRLVLQDLPQVLETVTDLPSEIEKVSHDFFTKQPVLGARAYFLHHVLHDWSDEDCRIILENIKPALKQDESMVLLNELLIPDTDSERSATALDLIMMATNCGRERSERAWRDLIESAGLRVVKVWSSPASVESVLQVEI